MNSKSISLRVILALFLVSISRADGCSCLQKPRQAKYCSADFSAKVKPVWMYDNNSGPWQGRYYFVQVLQTFKSTTPLGNAMLLKTPTSSAACGVTLNLNFEYNVNGYFYGAPTIGSINSCGWNEVWSAAQQYEPIGDWNCPYLYDQSIQAVPSNVISRD